MSKEQFFPWDRAQVERWIRAIEPKCYPQLYEDLVEDISERFGRHPLVEMEKILREIGSNTFLLAEPVMPSDRGNFIISMPYSGDDREYEFYLSFCFDGEEAAIREMARIETDYEQNLRDLGKTGLALVRPGSELASSLKGTFN